MSIHSVEKGPDYERQVIAVNKARWCTTPKIIGGVVLFVIVAAGISIGVWLAVANDDDNDDDDDFKNTDVPRVPWLEGGNFVSMSLQTVKIDLTISTQDLPPTQCQPCVLECNSTSCSWLCTNKRFSTDASLVVHTRMPFYGQVNCFCGTSSEWRCTKPEYTFVERGLTPFPEFLNSGGGCSVFDCLYFGSEELTHNWMCRNHRGQGFRQNTTSANQTANDEFLRLFSVGAVVQCNEAVAGRPYTLEGSSLRSPLSAECSTSDGWVSSIATETNANISSSAVKAATSQWLNAAQDEHASVASFSKFSIQLLAVAAPSHLVELSHRAALQEIEHAKLCFKAAVMIQGKGSEVMGPGKFPEHSLEISSDLREVASSTAKEGAIGETNAAITAAVRYNLFQELESREISSELASHISRSLKQIMMEEAEHAALAWRTLQWADVEIDFEAIRTHPHVSESQSPSFDKSNPLKHFSVLTEAENAYLSSVIFEEITVPLSKSIKSKKRVEIDVVHSALLQHGGDAVLSTVTHLVNSINKDRSDV